MTAQKPKSKRLSAEERAIAEAERLAAMLAEAQPLGPDQLAPPAYIADPRLAAAAVVWRTLAPQLEKTGRLCALDRFAFAELCYWRAEWLTAVDHILTHGYSFMGTAVAGGKRPWTNPNVARRDTAAAQLERLSAKFGLTPLDRIALNKNRLHVGDDDAELPLGRALNNKPDAEAEVAEVDPWKLRLPN